MSGAPPAAPSGWNHKAIAAFQAQVDENCSYERTMGGPTANLIVGGEGGLQFYEYVKLNDGHPVYRAAAPVHEVDAMLYLGSNAVISAVDWNSNGKTDIVAGNSEGLLQIFFNVGSDRFPEFLLGLPLFVEGPSSTTP